MWIEVFHRSKLLTETAYHFYFFPNPQFQFGTSDIETLIVFEKILLGSFELASDEILEKSFRILHSLYSRLQLNTKENKLLSEVASGKESSDFKKLEEIFTREKYEKGFDGLEAEFFVLFTEIKEYRKSPAIYNRFYRRARRFHFEIYRERLDPSGKIMQSLLALHDEIPLHKEVLLNRLCATTLPFNTGDWHSICLNVVLSCGNKQMLLDFVSSKRRKGRRPDGSIYSYVKNKLHSLYKCGLITALPSKNSFSKTMRKLRSNPILLTHLSRL